MADDEQRTPTPNLQEVGSSGLRRMGPYVYEEYLPELTAERGRKIIRQMIDDPLIGAALLAVEILTRQVSWRVDPASEQTEDVEAAEFASGVLFEDQKQTWEDCISEILTMLPWGFCWLETPWKRRGGYSRDPNQNSIFDDGRIGLRKAATRAQETLWGWEWAENGDVTHMKQWAPPKFEIVDIPLEPGPEGPGSLLFRASSHKNNPEGRSWLRPSWDPWTYKRGIQRIEAIGIERDLAGLPVGWVPTDVIQQNTTEARASYDGFKELIVNIRRDEQEGVLMPLAYDANGNKLYDLTLLSTGGTRQFDTDKIVFRYNQQILASVLADFILLGAQAVGSFALSKDKSGLFILGLGSVLDAIAAVWNRDFLPRLFRFNGMQLKRLPKLAHGNVQEISLAELGDFIQKLAGAGAPLFPNDELLNHVLSMAKLPAVGSEEARGLIQNSEDDEPSLRDELTQWRNETWSRPPRTRRRRVERDAKGLVTGVVEEEIGG